MRLRSNFPLFLKFIVLLQVLASLYYIFTTIPATLQQKIEDENKLFQINRVKSQRHLKIMIVMVVENIEKAEKEYSTALNSVKCYSKKHKYDFKLVEDQEFKNACPQNDFMFRRHCIVSHFLEKTDWLLFLDADVAVVNPNVLIEDYIDESYHLTFYDRFVNWEVAAGSYIVKNTPWSLDFLRKFADFENSLPNSFHGTDNGALHVYLQQLFYPHLSSDAEICLKIWEKSTNFDTLYTFESCIRAVMGENRFFNNMARILKKGTGWVRDIWITNSEWSPQRDFMLHGLKNSYMTNLSQGFLTNLLLTNFNWRNPFKSVISLENCPNDWEYDETLIVSNLKIEEYMTSKYVEVEKRKWNYLSYVSGYF